MDENVRILRPPWVDELLDDRYLLDTLMEHIPDQIYFKDAKSRFVRVSRALALRLGLDDPARAVGKTDFDFFAAEHAQKAFADEQQLLQTGEQLVGIEEHETWQDGREAWVSTTKVPLRDRNGRIVGLFGISRDITDKKLDELRLVEQTAQLAEQARALEELALLDELTGLNSRRGLQVLGEQALYSARRAGAPVALLFIDVDGLKQINDKLGHAAGDDALRALAQVIRSSIRDSDVAARIGGDEFCVLLPDKFGEAVERVRERITAGAEAARAEHSLPFELSATIGACEVDARTPGSLAELLDRADSVMYEQKRRRSSQLFAPRHSAVGGPGKPESSPNQPPLAPSPESRSEALVRAISPRGGPRCSRPPEVRGATDGAFMEQSGCKRRQPSAKARVKTCSAACEQLLTIATDCGHLSLQEGVKSGRSRRPVGVPSIGRSRWRPLPIVASGDGAGERSGRDLLAHERTRAADFLTACASSILAGGTNRGPTMSRRRCYASEASRSRMPWAETSMPLRS